VRTPGGHRPTRHVDALAVKSFDQTRDPTLQVHWLGMKRIDILGVPVDPMPSNELLDHVRRLHATGHATISYVNVHVVNTAQTDMALAAFLHATDLVYCDGNGIRLGARILGETIPARMTGADWIWELAAHAEGRWKLFWLGGVDGVANAAALHLKSQHPGLQIETDHGFHPRNGPEANALVARINSYAPDILLVGMGTPTQEMWVEANRSQLNVPVVWCVGAAADVLAGVESRGPDWLIEHSEWLARLVANPKAKWRRYLMGNPAFMFRVLGQRLGL